MNVDSAIQKTLRDTPYHFFHFSNGIAIQVRDSKLINRRDARTVGLSYQTVGDISVINGAQTIAAAGEFFFGPAPEAVEESEWEEKLARAKDEAWVLLRVIVPKRKLDGETERVFEQISISLNRQKPIIPVDIEYTNPTVAQINNLYEDHREDERYFGLLKRGQANDGVFQYQISEFARIVMAYYHNEPWITRSSSTQVIVQPAGSGKEDSKPGKTIYAPFEDAKDGNELFLQWYAPINFATYVSRLYADVAKKYGKRGETQDPNRAAVLGYGRYFFAAYLVNRLNPVLGQEQDKTFRDFPYTVSMVKCHEEQFEKMILEYSEKFAGYIKDSQVTASKPVFDSNDFKSAALYEQWCKYADASKEMQDWLEDVKTLLAPDT